MYSILLVLLICAPAPALAVVCEPCNLPGVVVFGDSDSDTGNSYALTNQTWPITPPYYSGRYSNGPIWVDDLIVPQKRNFAYGSATTDSNFVQGLAKLNTVPVPGVRQQVAQYLAGSQSSLSASLPCYLHTVWAGGNDFLFNNSITPQQIINSLVHSLVDLLTAGVKNLLVFNQAPGQYSPSFIGTNYAPYIAGLTQSANAYLNAALTQLKQTYPYASIYLFDTYSLIIKVLANSNNPPTFTNNNTACWTNYNLTTVIQHCSDPTKYVYADIFHFSSTVEQIIADNVQPFFSSNCADNENLGPYIISYNNMQGD